MKWSDRQISWFIALLTLAATVPFLGGSHLFDWDEVNFAEAAREMLLTGEFSYVQIGFQPFWEKPPLFIWMQAASMKLFGINEFAARLPNALCGALTLVLLFRIGARLVSRNFGLLWTLVYAGSFLSQFYFRSGIIDPWFNLLIFLGVHQLILASTEQRMSLRPIVLAGVFIGLAVLTKGPTALGLVGISALVYIALRYKRHRWKWHHPVVFTLVVLLVGFSWFFAEVMRGHDETVRAFIDYHIRLFAKGEASHAQPFFYHPLVLLFGCFPMSLFLVAGWFHRHQPEDRNVAHYRLWMRILFWVVLIVFSIVKTKIVHYSSLTYFPMSFLAAWHIHRLLQGHWRFSTAHQIVFLLFIGLFGSAFTLGGMMDRLKAPLLKLLENDPFAHANFSQHVPDGPFDPFIGLLFMVGAMASVHYLRMGFLRNGIIGLFVSSGLAVMFVSIFLAPKIDRYHQAALFEFYKDVTPQTYIRPMGFHSYAHLYYGQRPPLNTDDPLAYEDERTWMIEGNADRPVYYVSRIQDLPGTLKYFPFLKEERRIGGYVILQRGE